MTLPLVRDLPWLTLHLVVTALALSLYAVTSRALRRARQPDAAIAWVLFILLVPYVALPAYLLFGSRKRSGLRQRRKPEYGAGPGSTWLEAVTRALEQRPAAEFSDFSLHRDGQTALDELYATFDAAHETLDICTFILGRDALGAEVMRRLERKVAQGVRVRLLLDDLGSWMAGRPHLRALRKAGVQVRLFAPPWRTPAGVGSNLRDHRKLVIADAGLAPARLWSGGRNLASEYFLGDERKAPFRDLSFCLSGPLVNQAAELFEADWGFAVERSLSPLRPSFHAASPAAADVALAQLVASGPDQLDDTIHALLVAAVYHAEERISLLTPYFVPDPSLLDALCLAARRGVEVRLLLPAVSNHALSDVARRRALRALAEAGARIELVPVMHHAKLVLIDDQLALAGSANLDRRSFFLNYELMFAFRAGAEFAAFSSWYEHERRDASPYVPDQPGLLLDIAEGLVLWMVFQL